MQSSSSIIPNQQPSHKSRQRPSKKRIVLLIVAGVLVLALVSFGVYTLQSSSKDSAICSPQLIKKAVPLLDPEKLAELKPINDEILAKSNYANDVNCVYIVTNYSINSSDTVAVQRHYDQLVKIYNPEVGYSSEFGNNTISPDDVKRILEFLKTQDAEQNNNSFTGPAI